MIKFTEWKKRKINSLAAMYTWGQTTMVNNFWDANKDYDLLKINMFITKQ